MLLGRSMEGSFCHPSWQPQSRTLILISFPVSFSSAPWDHLRNKLPVPKFLSQVMLLGGTQTKETFFFS